MSNIHNTKYLPPNWKERVTEAQKSKAYYDLKPYPRWGFTQWISSYEGPLPKCLPVWKSLIDRSSRWLFRNGVGFIGDKEMSDWANQLIDESGLDSSLMRVGKELGWCGTVVIYWEYDVDNGVKFKILKPFWHCIVYPDHSDADKIALLRIQYPIFDLEDGKYKMFREEWSDDLHVKYALVEIDESQATRTMGGDVAENIEFEVESSEANPWGVVPAQVLKNNDTEFYLGEGDLWGLWGMIDQINLTANLMHVDNQMRVRPHKVYIDVEPVDNTVPTPNGPIQNEDLQSTKEVGSGDVKLLESNGTVRPAMDTYLQMLLRMSHEAAGSVYLNPTDITGFGLLSGNVVRMLMDPLVSTTEEKRKTVGEGGILKLFKKLAKALKKYPGVKPDHKPKGNENDLKLLWPNMLEKSTSEMQEETNVVVTEFQAGLLSFESASQLTSIKHGLDPSTERAKIIEEIGHAPKPGDSNEDTEDAPGGGDKREPASEDDKRRDRAKRHTIREAKGGLRARNQASGI